MELLVTLRKRELLEKVLPFVDGIIVGKFFTSSYHCSLKEIVEINVICKANQKKIYIVLDDFISEDDIDALYKYLEFIRKLEPDGIYFHDLGIVTAAKKYGLSDKLIYDGKTVACNSLDTAFLLSKGIDSVVLSRELTLEEIVRILQNNPRQIDLQIFGHQRLSYSKRRFLTNYFNEINKEFDYLDKEDLFLVEEQRDYKLPIIENEEGTFIYSDYVFEMFNELPDLIPYLRRGIVDTLFIEDQTVIDLCCDLHRLTGENKSFLRDNLYQNHPDRYSSGFLYQRTNITKDE
ncbi:MAG: U32 family peptidase [Erysipelotrichaceae bacterium]|nr:U32 family peptidase [Erysipelotrichaceae bacterium]